MDADRWNGCLAKLPGAHVLQTWEWGQIKAAYGWRVLPKIWGTDATPQAVALVLERALSARLPVRMLYAPRGPILDWSDQDHSRQVLDGLQSLARDRRAIFIKIDPEIVVGTGVPGTDSAREDETGVQIQAELAARGWRFSSAQVQFRNTVKIDLTRPEEDLLAGMKQKTRYNVRLAERKAVCVRRGEESDLALLYRMYAETAVRDGFVIRPEEYYLTVWRTFMQRGMAEPLIAEVGGEPVAGLVLFHFAGTSWYLYGMSRDTHREKMPNYLLQWEAIRAAKAAGSRVYDLWGAPDEFNESDSMWGVYRFKEGLGGQVVRTIGAWDYPVMPQLYTLFTRVLPRLLDVMRRRGQARTRREVTT